MTDSASEKKKEAMDKAYKAAFDYERMYGSCSQCVIAAISETVAPVSDDVFKASHALAAGCALTCQGTCGALVGGMLAISATHGRDRANFGEGRFINSYVLAKKLLERFEDEFGSHACPDVQKKIMGRSYDLWDPEDYKAFEAAGGHEDKCPDVVGKAAMWAVEVLLDEQKEQAGE
jgi:C_GCAxxG_C_C family probable redox protein